MMQAISYKGNVPTLFFVYVFKNRLKSQQESVVGNYNESVQSL